MSLQDLQNKENDAIIKYNSLNGADENSVLFLNQQQHQFQILLLLLCLVIFVTFKYLDMPSPIYNLFAITGVLLAVMLIIIQVFN
jgi:magnesium-transporting ATPase (P-type)